MVLSTRGRVSTIDDDCRSSLADRSRKGNPAGGNQPSAHVLVCDCACHLAALAKIQ
jgi:hypothetical protein